MQDRIVEFPNRYKIIPVAGSSDIVDLVPSPGVVANEGTAINKANLLKDVTATLFGLGTNAVPDDVFGVLSRFQNGLGNEYVWEKLTVGSGYREVRTNVTGDSIYTVKGAVYTYSNAINIDQSTGAVSLVNPLTITQGAYDSATVAETIVNKYFTVSAESGLFYCIATSSTQGNQLYITSYDIISSEAYTGTTSYGYVNSPDPNAYPVNDGYTYTALGQFGNKVQIATGSYTGTGTYGASNPNSLTFDFAPKFVLVFRLYDKRNGVLSAQPKGTVLFADGLCTPIGGAVVASGDFGYSMELVEFGTTLKWYSTKSANEQGNSSPTKYGYIAIG